MTETQLNNKLRSYIRIANERLKNIEREGLKDASNAYRYIESREFDNKNIFFTDAKHLHFNSTLKTMTLTEKKEILKTVTTFLNAKTSTVGGTRRKYEKSFRSFNRNREREGKEPFSFSQYTDLWNSYYLDNFNKTFGSLETVALVMEHGLMQAQAIEKRLFEYAEQRNLDRKDLTLEDIDKIKKRMFTNEHI